MLGTRFLDASYITQMFGRQKSFEEGKQVWDDYISECIRENSRVVKEFTKKFNNKQIINQSLSNELRLEDVCSKYSMSERQFLTYVTEVTPHPVYVQPYTRRVISANMVAKTEFKKAEAAMWW